MRRRPILALLAPAFPLLLAACSARVPTAPAPTVAVDSVGTTALLIGVGGAGQTVWAAGARGTWARSLDGFGEWFRPK